MSTDKGRLVLQVKENDFIQIGPDIRVYFRERVSSSQQWKHPTLTIEAPKNIPITRVANENK
jgi:sRNA-binding carbon storage regulator CsrA